MLTRSRLTSISIAVMALCATLFSAIAHSAGEVDPLGYLSNPRRGWHFYEDPPPPPKEGAKQERRRVPAKQAEDPQAKLKAFQKQVEDAKALAIIEPTEENVRRYMEIQQIVMSKGAVFADTWQRVLWKTPTLDSTLRHPVNAVGSWIDRDARRSEKEKAVRELAKTDGLFFFYKSSCAYCLAQAPILRRFAAQHGVTVIAVSLDGSYLPDFPDAKVDNGIADRFGVRDMPSPSIYMVNPKTGDRMVVSFGLVTETELTDRIYTLTQAKLGQF